MTVTIRGRRIRLKRLIQLAVQTFVAIAIVEAAALYLLGDVIGVPQALEAGLAFLAIIVAIVVE